MAEAKREGNGRSVDIIRHHLLTQYPIAHKSLKPPSSVDLSVIRQHSLLAAQHGGTNTCGGALALALALALV